MYGLSSYTINLRGKRDGDASSREEDVLVVMEVNEFTLVGGS